jgi:hypothetical protein
MIPFSAFLVEEKATKEDFGSLKSDPMGKLHEVLVGYHLRGGKHMDKHNDADGKSPKELHDEITAKLGGEKTTEYKNFSERARKAAEHIKQHLGLGPDDVKNVQWTSKAGDMERATGIKASQKEDDSDVVITDKKGRHHGVSLKVSADNKPITLSNNGTETTYGGAELLAAHKGSITSSYPKLSSLENDKAVVAKAREKETNRDKKTVPAAELRKAWLTLAPEKAKTDIKKKNLATLTGIAKNMHEKLSEMTPEQKAHHVRHIVLHAYSTPKEAYGHSHMRHFTGGGINPDMHISNPSKDHEFILNDPANITTKHSGTSVYYHYKGVPFAMQTAKFSSQSDPLSSVAVVGKEVTRVKDKTAIDKMRDEHHTTMAAKAAEEPAPVAPDQNITSQHIETNHPVLNKNKLSDYRAAIPMQQRRLPQTDSPFKSMAKPGIKTATKPGQNYREHTSGEHGGLQF